MESPPFATLEELHAEVRQCRLCPLCSSRLKAVPGEGNTKTKIMFIGEAPGWYENQQGRPFVGPAGQLLEELLASISLSRSDVFITNIVKCRPPGNRDPLPEEIRACSPYLEQQIALIDPRLIVTLGRYSMALFFPPNGKISTLHGTTVRKGNLLCYALYHPAAALRTPTLRSVLEQDFRRIPELLKQSEDKPVPEQTKPQEQQLSLF